MFALPCPSRKHLSTLIILRHKQVVLTPQLSPPWRQILSSLARPCAIPVVTVRTRIPAADAGRREQQKNVYTEMQIRQSGLVHAFVIVRPHEREPSMNDSNSASSNRLSPTDPSQQVVFSIGDLLCEIPFFRETALDGTSAAALEFACRVSAHGLSNFRDRVSTSQTLLIDWVETKDIAFIKSVCQCLHVLTMLLRTPGKILPQLNVLSCDAQYLALARFFLYDGLRIFVCSGKISDEQQIIVLVENLTTYAPNLESVRVLVWCPQPVAESTTTSAAVLLFQKLHNLEELCITVLDSSLAAIASSQPVPPLHEIALKIAEEPDQETCSFDLTLAGPRMRLDVIWKFLPLAAEHGLCVRNLRVGAMDYSPDGDDVTTFVLLASALWPDVASLDFTVCPAPHHPPPTLTWITHLDALAQFRSLRTLRLRTPTLVFTTHDLDRLAPWPALATLEQLDISTHAPRLTLDTALAFFAARCPALTDMCISVRLDLDSARSVLRTVTPFARLRRLRIPLPNDRIHRPVLVAEFLFRVLPAGCAVDVSGDSGAPPFAPWSQAEVAEQWRAVALRLAQLRDGSVQPLFEPSDDPPDMSIIEMPIPYSGMML